jgi:glycine betaine catabolism B
MMRIIDRFLNRFTMYRLTLYYLIALLGLGLVLSFLGTVPGGLLAMVSSTAILIVVCHFANLGLARIWRVRSNPESSLITALILALISNPVSPFSDMRHAAVLALSALVAIASKYVLALRRQHVFNPAALGALFSGLIFGSFATWWVGNLAFLPLAALGGLLLARKISRLRFIAVFFVAFIFFMVGLALAQGLSMDMALQSLIFVFGQTSLLFFAFIMLTEPMTSPKRFPLQAIDAVIVALLYQPQLTLLGQNFTPEEALLIGNLFSFLVSPSFKVKLALKERRLIGPGTMSFTFPRPTGFTHRLGQYMEWTLPMGKSGSGGIRRHFSIASSPTEPDLLIAARIPEDASRFKQALAGMSPGDPILAGELGGDFVLPREPRLPLAFIAGGIGITPFRSMIKYLVDTGDRRDIVLLYANRLEGEIVFRDVFTDAERSIGLKTVYTLTDLKNARPEWCGHRGPIDRSMIGEKVPAWKDRLFFVSGPPGMVDAVKAALRSLGVPRRRVRTDAFTGYF